SRTLHSFPTRRSSDLNASVAEVSSTTTAGADFALSHVEASWLARCISASHGLTAPAIQEFASGLGSAITAGVTVAAGSETGGGGGTSGNSGTDGAVDSRS